MIGALLALALAQSPVLQDRDKGSTLYKQCLVSIRFDDGSSVHMSESDADAAHTCITYIDGISAGLRISKTPMICLPEETSFGTMARIYVNYMAQNPKNMDKHKAVGLVTALMENYPCRVQVK